MKEKQIEGILAPPAPHMVGDGFRVHNFFPGGYNMGQYRMSPFFLLDYNSLIDFSARATPRGVGVHPHRGFETVTIAFKGKVAHHDSYGNSGVIGEGDVQWMTAGSGVLHKEYHEEEYSKTGGPFQMVQLWVNLPAAFKMTTPKYQTITHDQMGKYENPDKTVLVNVIAGAFKNVKGPASTFTPIEMYIINLKKDAGIDFTLPENFNSAMLIVKGSCKVNNGEIAEPDHFVIFRNDGEQIVINATEDCTVLVLSGEPIKETIVAYGPFLMNTKDEIKKAYEDVNAGLFGVLEE
ncbi:MAG: pirin family protein [Bacteroidota bacterium]